jgi:dsRNA-specific ribonuclease
MSENAKNQLFEILKNLGCLEEHAAFQTTLLSPPPNSQHSTVVTVIFPDERVVKGTGKGQRKVDAELIAAQSAIDILRNIYPELLVNWDEIYVEALYVP